MMNLYNYERITSGKASMSLIPAYLFDVAESEFSVWRGKRQIIQTFKPTAIYDIHGRATSKRLAQVEIFGLANLLLLRQAWVSNGIHRIHGFESYDELLEAYGRYYSKNPLAWLLKFKANQ